MYVNYSQIPGFIAARKGFEGNTMSAEVRPSHVSMGRIHNRSDIQDIFDRATVKYVVFSYGTPIAVETEEDGPIVFDIRFSRTTSKHQGKCHQGFGTYREM